MRLLLPMLLIVPLLGCGENAAQAAERRYAFLEKNGAGELELCAAAKQVAEAFVDEGNSLDYQRWDTRADLHCNQDALDKAARY